MGSCRLLHLGCAFDKSLGAIASWEHDDSEACCEEGEKVLESTSLVKSWVSIVPRKVGILLHDKGRAKMVLPNLHMADTKVILVLGAGRSSPHHRAFVGAGGARM